MEYAECEAVVKDFPPFREAMKKRGIEDMDLVMVDPWLVTASRLFDWHIMRIYFSYVLFYLILVVLKLVGVLDITVKLMLLAEDLLNH